MQAGYVSRPAKSRLAGEVALRGVKAQPQPRRRNPSHPHAWRRQAASVTPAATLLQDDCERMHHTFDVLVFG